MEYALKTVILADQKRIVSRYGDRIWELICDEFAGNFRLADAAAVVAKDLGVSPRTAKDWARIVLRNVEELGGPATRVSGRVWSVVR
jgi:hypothetical protein